MVDFDFKRRDPERSGMGQMNLLLSSLYNEFEMQATVDLSILFETQTIDENEYREIWMSIPKEDHITFELTVPNKVLQDGTLLNILPNLISSTAIITREYF